MSETISVLVSSFDVGKGIFSDAHMTLADIPLDKLRTGLSDLVGKLKLVTADIATAGGALSLRQLEVGVELTAEGGVSLVGTAKAGAKASIKLTFTVDK